MKKLNVHFKIILLISAFLISSKNLYSQWTIAGDLAGVAGPRPVVSVVDGNTAFVTGGSDINATYKTTNGGTNWIQLNTAAFRPFWSIFAKDANTVFAGDDGNEGRINFYKTTNGGNNWTLIDSISGSSAGFRGIRFSNSIPSIGIAYAPTDNQDFYIYKTRDGGNTWTRTLVPGYPGFGITGGLNVIDSLFYAFGAFGSPPSIIITTDGGVTWNLRDVNLQSGGFGFTRGLAFKDKLTGIAASNSLPIISRTTNGGLNWANIDVGNNITNTNSLPPVMTWVEGTNICYVTANTSTTGVINGILKSTNGGLNWTAMTTSGFGTIYMDTKRIGVNIYGYANSTVPGAFGGNQVLKLTDVIPTQQILYGDSITLGNGVVRTWVRVNALGRREQIGVSMTDGVMNNLDTIRREFDLALPPPVAADDTTFNHVFFIWNPQGHPPPGINEVPHFDFHFSTVSVAERQAVIPGIDPVYYPREFVPKDYKQDNFPPGVTPNRGLHWGDTLNPQNNQTLTHTFFYTTYRGKRLSWAPQITRAFLLTNRDTIIAIKQSKLYRRAGRYPLNYSITHDPVNQTYDVVLRTFVHKEATPTNPFIGITNAMMNGVSDTLGCGSPITGGDSVSVDFDITASDWDVGDSVTLSASFSNPTGGATVTFTPSLPVRGNPARTHLHFVSNGEYFGVLTILATDRSGNTTQCNMTLDFPLPVELTSFVSTIHENDVTLNWTTASEDNNEGFEIERRDARGQTQDVWNKIGNVQGNGTSSLPQNYSYKDRNLSSGRYKYRLKQIDFNGNYRYHNLNNEVVIGVPTRFELSQNYPNPFNPKTIINYEIPVTTNVSIKVYDISGKEVSILVNQIQNAGYYAIDFPTTGRGSNYSSGVYFYRLIVNGNIIDTKRMVLLK